MADEAGSFEVNGKRYSLPDSVTLGEMADAEQFFGVQFGDGDGSRIRMSLAMMFIAIRREDPSVTVEDIRELPSSVLESVVALDADPLVPAASDASSEKSATSGDPSELAGESPDAIPEATGNHSSDIGSDSALLTSRT